MKIKLFQVDAFASKPFEGNPAAVCPLKQWLDDDTLQAIAAENNLSETAFLVPRGREFQLRWFTPVAEVDLCGHATLATAHVLFELLDYPDGTIIFSTNSGRLTVERHPRGLAMDFPARVPEPCSPPPALLEGLGVTPMETLVADDYIAVLADEAAVRAVAPNQSMLATLDRRGVIVTASGDSVDFVSRFFAPKHGIPEDPVTGSAHSALAPYWARRLDRTELEGRQLSARGGTVLCELRGERVQLIGSAVTFLEGVISVP